MATLKNRPVNQFNFLVDIGDQNTTGPHAGFQEVSGMGVEITVAEYRNGNSTDNSAMKVAGLHKSSDVTFKRGVFGSLSLYSWLDDVRTGKPNSLRSVSISLMSEDQSETIMTWRLLRAQIIKYTGAALNAKGSDVAVEEVTVGCEGIVVE